MDIGENKDLLFITFLCLSSMCVSLSVYHRIQLEVKGQLSKSWFFASTMSVSGIELRSSGLVVSALPAEPY